METPHMTLCPLCGGSISHRQVVATARWGKASVRIAGVNADVCENCGEQYYSPEEAMRMQSAAEALSSST